MFYERLDYSLFESRFKDYNRLHNFPKGLRDLYDYLEELAETVVIPVDEETIIYQSF